MAFGAPGSHRSQSRRRAVKDKLWPKLWLRLRAGAVEMDAWQADMLSL